MPGKGAGAAVRWRPQEVADELGALICAGETVLARPVVKARIWRWCRRKPSLTALARRCSCWNRAFIACIGYVIVQARRRRIRLEKRLPGEPNRWSAAALAAPADAVPYAIQNLEPLRELAIPILGRHYEDGQLPQSQRLRAAFAMAALGRVERDFLVESIASARPDECRNLIAARRRSRSRPCRACAGRQSRQGSARTGLRRPDSP